MEPDFSRYSCQLALPGFSKSSQHALQQAKVLIVGAGGLGCPAAQYLTAAGIGTLGIADFDTVSISNLHRQVLYTPADTGRKKVTIACGRLQEQNPEVTLIPHDIRLTSANVKDLIGQYDIIIDGTDNFETRYLINDACVIAGKPVVYGAIYQFEGQVALWNNINADGTRSPNYRDLFPKVDATQIPDCAVGGVIPTLAGIIGCIQANEVIKYITKTGELLAGKVMVFDALTLQSRIIKIGKVTKTNITALAETTDAPTLSVSEVKKGLADGTLELVDIRTDRERDEIDIGGVHFEADEIDENMEYLTNYKVKVLYCSSGKRSAEAVKLIRQKSPGAKVFSLEGGLQAWFSEKP
ncbi:HesA/MoeB/ThiF family protein [Mucilaginibacter sp. UR6-11]|uniref:HesA/MoeB/ThiF family protein n=1 Tax=Mucilaginibacter sp. UR6-11 TaxID=1435644 RepID=UPI001E2AA743|nr:HesA/MoeB/ThiF family protein [Mucilaginibacter sp. UR6-11]MCC8426280.1 HesA/MoeB/ThiF family protein [Mucilaginibacter sp. UR6-11]